LLRRAVVALLDLHSRFSAPTLLYFAGSLWKGARLSGTDAGPTHTITGLITKPKGAGPFPAVVLLPTCEGLQPHVTKVWPEYLTRLGYATVTVDSLGPRGLRRCAIELVRDSPALTRDAYGALVYLASLAFVDKDRIGVMGFSMGALTINYFAGRHIRLSSGLTFKAAVCLYGACFALRPSPGMIPLTIIVGNRDKEMIVSSCSAVPNHPSIRVHVLPDTYHAFDRPEITTIRYDFVGSPMLYSAAATRAAQEITKEFFAQHLGR
jgi:dienelactone hydrolase